MLRNYSKRKPYLQVSSYFYFIAITIINIISILEEKGMKRAPLPVETYGRIETLRYFIIILEGLEIYYWL